MVPFTSEVVLLLQDVEGLCTSQWDRVTVGLEEISFLKQQRALAPQEGELVS